ncbi:RTC4-like domain-containing protein [Lipomyces arxii]|uniref:RTC4-like domain-containing protein n=1 Tax=Lipomyces arxii TaxID=56418 RepID=UPI0034CF26A5
MKSNSSRISSERQTRLFGSNGLLADDHQNIRDGKRKVESRIETTDGEENKRAKASNFKDLYAQANLAPNKIFKSATRSEGISAPTNDYSFLDSSQTDAGSNQFTSQRSYSSSIKYSRRRQGISNHSVRLDMSDEDWKLDVPLRGPAKTDHQRYVDEFKSMISTTQSSLANCEKLSRTNLLSSPRQMDDDSDQGLGLGGENFLSSSPQSSQIAEEERRIEREKLMRQKEDAKAFKEALNADEKLLVCPICGFKLSEKIRAKYVNYPDSLRRSYAVCNAHNSESVMESAKGKNYPTVINDTELEERAEKLSSVLENIISEREHSEFHEKCKESTRLRRGRRVDALAQLEEGFDEALPGYYGLRGSGILLRVALRHAGELIRRHKQTWISSISITGYATAVLVPELAIRLIMDDQGVDREHAMDIRVKSVEYGRAMFGDEEEDETGQTSQTSPIRSKLKSTKPIDHYVVENAQIESRAKSLARLGSLMR